MVSARRLRPSPGETTGRESPGAGADARPSLAPMSTDPRIVDLYDLDNPDGPDHDHYRALADDVDARTIVDLGCGTGMLTVSLARPGRRVFGVDPTTAMLAFARRRPGAEAVTWVDGDSRALGGLHLVDGVEGSDGVDYAVLTGNVVQHIPDPDWQRTLIDLRRVVRVGGTLAFESRNPAVRAWEDWAAEPPSSRDTVHGRLREWYEVSEVAPGRIGLASHTVFEVTGEHVVDRTELAFRDRATIEAQLAAAGFALEGLAGDFTGGAFDPDASRVLVVRAVAV